MSSVSAQLAPCGGQPPSAVRTGGGACPPRLGRTTEGGVDVGVVRTEPIPETPADQLTRGGGRSSLENVVFAVEEVCGVVCIRRHRLETRESVEHRRRPLP